MAGRHAAPGPAGRGRRAAALAVGLVLFASPVTAASAHNHAANPSGVCNQSGQGTSPGNSGETNLNPAGKPVGKANAGATRANCPASR